MVKSTKLNEILCCSPQAFVGSPQKQQMFLYFLCKDKSLKTQPGGEEFFRQKIAMLDEGFLIRWSWKQYNEDNLADWGGGR